MLTEHLLVEAKAGSEVNVHGRLGNADPDSATYDDTVQSCPKHGAATIGAGQFAFAAYKLEAHSQHPKYCLFLTTVIWLCMYLKLAVAEQQTPLLGSGSLVSQQQADVDAKDCAPDSSKLLPLR